MSTTFPRCARRFLSRYFVAHGQQTARHRKPNNCWSFTRHRTPSPRARRWVGFCNRDLCTKVHMPSPRARRWVVRFSLCVQLDTCQARPAVGGCTSLKNLKNSPRPGPTRSLFRPRCPIIRPPMGHKPPLPLAAQQGHQKPPPGPIPPLPAPLATIAPAPAGGWLDQLTATAPAPLAMFCHAGIPFCCVISTTAGRAAVAQVPVSRPVW